MSFCILRLWILSMPIQSKYFYMLGHGSLRFLQISTPRLCDLELTIEGGPEVVIGEMEITVVDNLCQAGRGNATVAITFCALRSYYPSYKYRRHILLLGYVEHVAAVVPFDLVWNDFGSSRVGWHQVQIKPHQTAPTTTHHHHLALSIHHHQ